MATRFSRLPQSALGIGPISRRKTRQVPTAPEARNCFPPCWLWGPVDDPRRHQCGRAASLTRPVGPMPPYTGAENSGGTQRDLEDSNGPPTIAILTPTAAQPLPVGYTNVDYSGAGFWPDSYSASYSGLSTRDSGYNPTDVYQAQHWHDTSNQAPSNSTALYNAWGAGSSLADVEFLSCSPEGLVGQAEARQSARQDFNTPFPTSASLESNEITSGTPRIGSVSKPSETKTISQPANQARETLEQASDQATTGSTASAGRTVKKQSSYTSSMPPIIPSGGRRSDDGASHNGTRKVSRDSARSDRDKHAGDAAPAPVRVDSGNDGGIRRSILRKNQVDAFEDFSGLPAEKGFPIQVLMLLSLNLEVLPTLIRHRLAANSSVYQVPQS